MTRETTPPIAAGLGRTVALTGFLLIFVPLCLAAQNSDAERSTADGVFTEEQAETGEETFDQLCAPCHFSRQFRGGFMDSWTGSTVYALYRMIRQTMPQDRPGSLSQQQYTDIVTYLLDLNGMPAGDSPLAPEEEALKNVLIERSQNR